MQPTYWFWEGAIPSEICQDIIREHFSDKEALYAKVRTADQDLFLSKKKRKTSITWALQGSLVFDILYRHIQSANDLGEWHYDITGMEDVQIGKYTNRGHYDWHNDIDQPCKDRFQRKLSCSLQLSEEDSYEGGDLILQKASGDEYTAPRKQGSIVVFPSILRHKVTPVTSGTRFSAVAWMRGPAFK